MNPEEILDEAMSVGEGNQTTSAVMDVLEGTAEKLGRSDRLQDQRWHALRKKSPKEVIPYIFQCIKDEGLLSGDGILAKLGNQALKLLG